MFSYTRHIPLIYFTTALQWALDLHDMVGTGFRGYHPWCVHNIKHTVALHEQVVPDLLATLSIAPQMCRTTVTRASYHNNRSRAGRSNDGKN